MPVPETTHQEAVAAFRLSVVGDLLIRDLELGELTEELQRKAQAVGVDGPVRYALFARTGFTEALTRRAGEEGVTLVGLEELVQG